jgi:hypothetical protein
MSIATCFYHVKLKQRKIEDRGRFSGKRKQCKTENTVPPRIKTVAEQRELGEQKGFNNTLHFCLLAGRNESSLL